MFVLFGKLKFSEGNVPLLPGDILCVKRKRDCYRHFGVYIGRGRVVHYAATRGDFDKHEEATVHISSLEGFLRKEKTFYRVNGDAALSPGKGRRTGHHHSPGTAAVLTASEGSMPHSSLPEYSERLLHSKQVTPVPDCPFFMLKKTAPLPGNGFYRQIFPCRISFLPIIDRILIFLKPVK